MYNEYTINKYSIMLSKRCWIQKGTCVIPFICNSKNRQKKIDGNKCQKNAFLRLGILAGKGY